MAPCLLGLLLLHAGFALGHPDTSLGFKMVCSAEDPFPYWVDSRTATPAGIPLASVTAAAASAYRTWEDVACASTAFRFAGMSSDEPSLVDVTDTQDTFSVSAIWVTRKDDPAYGLVLSGGAATAAAVPLAYSGRVYQCDIFLNAVDRAWSTDAPTPAGAVDLQTHLLHEIGHCQGLGHSAISGDVMYAVTPLGSQRRVLTAHDAQDLCALYPQAGEVGSPCDAQSSCTQSLSCARLPQQDGGVGAAFCTRGCTPGDQTCPSPYVCAAANVVAGATHACVPATATDVVQVGRPCTQEAQCGGAAGICLRENAPGPLPSGATAWAGGYCSQACQSDADCPAQAACVETSPGVGRCLRTCRVGTGDCRQGYSCAPTQSEGPPVCVPACASDADCSSTGEASCRTCDGVCLAKQNPAGALGSACARSEECGPGQDCLFFSNSPVGVCTSSCGHVCALCPSSFSCVPAGLSAELYCLQNCQAATCAAGLACGLLPEGRFCVSPCSRDEDCPVGNSCRMGACFNPFAADAGGDGGASESPAPGGCGCGTGGVVAAWPWALLATLFWASARRGRGSRASVR